MVDPTDKKMEGHNLMESGCIPSYESNAVFGQTLLLVSQGCDGPQQSNHHHAEFHPIAGSDGKFGPFFFGAPIQQHRSHKAGKSANESAQ
jgi:hypothetical protein